MDQLRRVISEFGRRIIEHPDQLKAAFAELGGAPGVDGKRFEAILAASRTGVAARIRDSESASTERVDEWVHTLTYAGCTRADAVAAIADWGDALGATEVATIARGLAGSIEADAGVAEAAEAPPSIEEVVWSPREEVGAAQESEQGADGLVRGWRPALLSAAALLVGLAVLVPILVATSARPAVAEIKDEPSGLFQAGDLPQFILTEDQLTGILPAATATEPTPQGELPIPPATTDPVECATAYLSVPGPTARSSGPYGLVMTDGQFSLSSTARYYPSVAEAELAFDDLTPPDQCSSFQLSTGQAVLPVTYSAIRTAGGSAEGGPVTFADSQTIVGAFTVTRVCGRSLNVVACVQLQGPGASAFDALLDARDTITVRFARADPFEIPAPSGDQR